MPTVDELLDTPAEPVDGQHGTTNTALIVRFRDGASVPVGVQTGRCAREYLSIYNDHGAVVVGVRRGALTLDLVREPSDVLREAQRRLAQDAVLRYHAEVTSRVLRELRRRPAFAPGEEPLDDVTVAAIALVVGGLPLPGAQV